MDKPNIKLDSEDSLQRFSSDDDLFSDQPLLDDESFEAGRYQRINFRRLRDRILPWYNIMTILFFGLSLAILGFTFFTGDLDRTCLKRMTGWCKFTNTFNHKYSVTIQSDEANEQHHFMR